MSPIKPETCTHLKHLKSMVTHRLSRFSYIISFFYYPTQCVGLSFIFFTGQLNVLAYLFLFFTGQLSMLAYYTAARWLLLVALPHARKIFLEVLAINRHRKLDTIQLFKHRHFQAKPDQPCTAHAKLETTCHIFYLWFPMAILPPKPSLQPGNSLA